MLHNTIGNIPYYGVRYNGIRCLKRKSRRRPNDLWGLYRRPAMAVLSSLTASRPPSDRYAIEREHAITERGNGA